MRIEHIRYAEAALRHGSLRRAAQELQISQPSLSQQIQRLEEDLGVVLFVRTASGIRPTSAAEALADHFHELLRADIGMRQAAAAVGSVRGGELRVCSVPTVCRIILPTAVRKFRDEHPNVTLQATESGTNSVRDGVLRGDFDLGIISRFPQSSYHQDLTYADLIPNESKLCVPYSHRLSHRQTVDADDLTDEPLIVFRPGYLLHEIYQRLSTGRELRPIFYTESSATALALVAAEVGVAIVPALAVPSGDPERRRYRAITLNVPWTRTVVSAIRRADERPAPAALALLKILRRVVATSDFNPS